MTRLWFTKPDRGFRDLVRPYISLARRHFLLILILAILLLTLLAWSNRFIQDDAFISFRYAGHLVQGKGLVWNEGERVEGYTNFLWTLLVALGLYCRCEPVLFTQVFGLGLFVLTLVLTYQLGRLLFEAQWAALLAVVLLGTNYTFSAYATGGLETQLQACLGTAVAWLALRPSTATSRTSLLALSLLTSAALLTRLDSAVFLFVLFPVVVLNVITTPGTAGQRLLRLACLCAAPLVIVGGWLTWKLWYYGDILPNTYYAKVSSVASHLRGAIYCREFLLAYWLIPFVFLGLAASKKILKGDVKTRTLVLTVLVWCAYVCKVGGDFMEFRFFVPALPLIFVLVTWLLLCFLQQWSVRIALAVMLLMGSLHHAKTYDSGSIESIHQLQGHLYEGDENWAGVGRKLGQLFGQEDGAVVLAAGQAGAIPYYCGLKTIDLLGLNDPWIARHGTILESTPGHRRLATLDYLVERGVHLVVTYPSLAVGQVSSVPWPVAALGPLPPQAQIIEIPLDGEYRITLLYLVQNDQVDRVIREHRLQTHSLAGSAAVRLSRQPAGAYYSR